MGMGLRCDVVIDMWGVTQCRWMIHRAGNWRVTQGITQGETVLQVFWKFWVVVYGLVTLPSRNMKVVLQGNACPEEIWEPRTVHSVVYPIVLWWVTRWAGCDMGINMMSVLHWRWPCSCNGMVVVVKIVIIKNKWVHKVRVVVIRGRQSRGWDGCYPVSSFFESRFFLVKQSFSACL